MILKSLALLQKAKETPTTLSHNFGTIILKTDDSEIPDAVYHIILSSDFSGSMGNSVSDGKTALEHSKIVIRNILTHLATLDVVVYLTFRLFDHDGIVICEQKKITPTSVREIMDQLNPIMPRGSTNIKQACAYAKGKAMANARNSHILLTDGCPYSDSTWTIGQGVLNTGGTKAAAAKAMADHIYTEMPDMDNYLIGLGPGVNSDLLNSLNNRPNGRGYHFVDNVELAGMVYGEITYEIFHDSARDVSLQVADDCQLYDWRTNTWCNQVTVGNISAGKEHRVSVRIPWDAEDIRVTCKYLQEDDNVTDELVCQDYKRDEECTVGDRDVETDKWRWRQKTLALLYQSNNLTSDLVELALGTLQTNMRSWMAEKDLVADPFMLQLCMDITNTLADLRIPLTAATAIYRSARLTSQGRQRAFRVGAVPQTVPPRPGLTRGSSAPQSQRRTAAPTFPGFVGSPAAAASPSPVGGGRGTAAPTFPGFVGSPTAPAPPPPPGLGAGGRGTSAYTAPSQAQWMRQQTMG